MRSGVDGLLYQHGFLTDGYFLGTFYIGKLVQAELLGLGALHLFSQALVEYHNIIGWTALLCCDNKRALEVSAHPCKVRRHTPQSQGGQTASQRHVLLRSRLRSYGPYAKVGATYVNPANQLSMRHPSEMLGDLSNKPWLS
jgi:hypothetical protein